jgi:S-DNA-T family DNA segregation ATPase FtsK/SpoIIIE
MADSGTRNISGYNEKIKKGKLKLVSEEEASRLLETDPESAAHTGKLPYIVIVIDEMADLMMTSGPEMEEVVVRLAQMARASGIHLILATQRPSVDVVTGLIKANFPARISFKVSSRHDSRTILDGVGAEQLLGMGDMLYLSPTENGIIRHHGCLVTDSEIARVIAHLKQQGKPIYNESILHEDKSSSDVTPGFEDVDNELYDKAISIVCESKQASISMVQRRMRIGYNRAARLIERMEAEGVVGPAMGSKPREVLAGSLK